MVLSDKLGDLRVTGCDLLQDRLQHLRLLLNKLAELLEVRVISEKVKIRESLSCPSSCFCSCCSSSARARTSSTSRSLLVSGLCGGIKEVYWFITARCWCTACCGWGTLARYRGRLSLRGLLLDIVRDSLDLTNLLVRPSSEEPYSRGRRGERAYR